MVDVTSGYLLGLFNFQSTDWSGYGSVAGGISARSRNVGAGTVGSIDSLRQAERDKDRQITRTAQELQVKREISAFRAGIAKATSAEGALSDPAILKVLLRANGLGDQEAFPALARKALLADLSDEKSLVHRLTDQRWKAVAQTYDMARQGLAILRDPRVQERLTLAYAEVNWRESLNAATPGLSDALTFREMAGDIRSSLQILGDPILRRVVTTALGLPLQIAFQSLEAQQKAIDSRLDVTRFRDPKFVDTFSQRYLLAAADTNGTGGGGNQGVLNSVMSGLVV